MKKSKLIYTAIAAALLAAAIGASAQSDSSNVPPLRGSPMVDLPHQVRQELSTYVNYGQVTGGGLGTWLAQGFAFCNGSDIVISGGGQCWTGRDSFGRMRDSFPSGDNAWVLVCGADENGSDGTIQGQAYVICSR